MGEIFYIFKRRRNEISREVAKNFIRVKYFIMRKIILDLAVTLDGFIEGPNGEIDWCNMDPEPDSTDFLGDLLDDIDSIFYGRISYDLWGNFIPGEDLPVEMKWAYEKINAKKKYVFSTTKTTDDKAVIVNSNIKERVMEILQQPGKNIWMYGGAKLITTFINYGLIDVYRLAVHPVILGSGKPLFKDIVQRVNLKLIDTKSSNSGVIMLKYERTIR